MEKLSKHSKMALGAIVVLGLLIVGYAFVRRCSAGLLYSQNGAERKGEPVVDDPELENIIHPQKNKTKNI